MELSKEERKRIKAEAKAKKMISESSSIPSNNHKHTVLCVKFGNKYSRDYVERLRNMVSRHLTIPYEFVCLTDDKHPIDGVRSIVIPNAGYTKGWWHKVHMFDPSLPLNGRILYMDLDVIVCGNIDNLFTYHSNDFLGIRDFNRKFHTTFNSLNSSVMCWNAGEKSYIFDQFISNIVGAQRMHGDQDWIWHVAKHDIKFWPDEWIQSYKWEIRDKNEVAYNQGVRTFKTIRNPSIPKSCNIVVFHGDPKPENIKDPFVLDNWR